MHRPHRKHSPHPLHSLALAAGLALASGAALAQTAPNPQPPANGNQSTPLDRDGKAPDAAAAYRLSFQRADANNDGQLSREEAQNLPAIFEKFDQWDHDGDGHIAEKEFLEKARVTTP